MDTKYIELKKELWAFKSKTLQHTYVLINSLISNLKDKGFEELPFNEESLKADREFDDIVVAYLKLNAIKHNQLQKFHGGFFSDPRMERLAKEIALLYEQNANLFDSLNDLRKHLTDQANMNALLSIYIWVLADKIDDKPEEIKKIQEEIIRLHKSMLGIESKVSETLVPLKEKLDQWQDLDTKHEKEAHGIA